ncbi:DEAD/DEAH box helicase [Herbiconiux moechotypicola]|uniref:DEAD/DEAH box helicase n=1 Tax=Herbiconiux moechotypicola TaxID=637393 RepID=A0ABP5QHE2_9MICO|nr:DEAD/DEAH box helicase [Herbiconiux moechotypicola]MCS5730192.1 DEAD/DEAH box helicase [Herbiconiux moechotypicola]
MPKSPKSGGYKPVKNYEPRTPGKGGAKGGAAKPGSRSPKHRGFRPEEEQEAPRKQRWNADDRAARGGDPVRRGGARRDDDARGDSRRGGERDARGERAGGGGRYGSGSGERDARGGSAGGYGRDARGSRGGSAGGYGRDDRGSRGGSAGGYGRDDRGSQGGSTGGYGRDDRGSRGGYERPSRENGFNRSGPGAGRTRDRDGFDRDDRPARDDRGAGDRSGYDRGGVGRGGYGDRDTRGGRDDRGGRAGSADRTDRGGYGDRGDRASRGGFGGRSDDDRGGRAGSAGRGDYGDRADRGGYAERADRGSRSGWDRDGGRASGGYGRDDRAAARGQRDDRRGDRGFERGGFDRGRPEGREKPRGYEVDDVVLERLEATATLAADVEGVTFADLGLGGNIVKALAELGAEQPFPIQAATIPEVLAAKDVLGRGRTGSGKTIAFGAPLVERLMENGGGKNRKPGRKPRALILAPTRELALQIDRTVQPIARSVGLFTTQIYGGVSQHRQVGALQRGVDIVIGTPGRIEDLIEQRRLDLSEVTVTVLDEADHMCDLGFLEPVQRILRRTAPKGQKLLFSATLDKGVATLVDEFLVDPVVHEVAGEDQASSTIDHHVLVVDHRDKDAVIEQLADRHGKTLVFTRTRAYAERLADQLDEAGLASTSLHGDLNQARRTRNLQQLTSGRVDILVATDVAARGIHVDDIDLVIQADAPDEYKTYLHRAGRTGRAGKQGTVVTIVPRSRRRRMEELLDRAEIEAEFVQVVPGDPFVSELAAAAAAGVGAADAAASDASVSVDASAGSDASASDASAAE